MGSKTNRVSVVAVNLNEEKTIRKVLKGIPSSVDEVIVVDGHSKDKSAQIARDMGFKVVMQEGKGRGAAFKTGFKYVQWDIIVMLSTDGNERAGHITSLVDKINEGYDLVIASRFGEGKSHDVTIIRRFGNWFLTASINFLGGVKIVDSQNGFRAVRKRYLDKMNIEADRFDIEAEITMKAARMGLRIVEVPTIEDDREFGNSNLNTFRDGLMIFKRIIKEALRRPPY